MFQPPLRCTLQLKHVFLALKREKSEKSDRELMPPPPLPQMEVKDGVIKKFTLPPPSDGFQSRDEVCLVHIF